MKNLDDSSLIGNGSSTLSFNPVRLSDAANYSCLVTIGSSYLTGNIAMMASFKVKIHSEKRVPYIDITVYIFTLGTLHARIILVPAPSYISLTSSKLNTIRVIGSDVRLTCAVELNPAILDSEIFLLTVDTQLFRNGTSLPLTGPTVTGTTFTYTSQLNSFQRNDFGNYTCTATVRPHPTSTYLLGVDTLSDTLNIKAGKC